MINGSNQAIRIVGIRYQIVNDLVNQWIRDTL